MRTNTTRRIATGLGWFSIALGVTEVIAAEPLARILGMKSPRMLRLFGVREIVAGIGLLTQGKKGPWILARILGDGLDVAALGTALLPSNPRRGNAAIAAAAVAPVVALDVMCGKELRVWN